MKNKTTHTLLLGALILPFLSSCGSTSSSSNSTVTGLDPYERASAVKRQPLSDDPNSPMHKMRAADGQVGLRVAEF